MNKGDLIKAIATKAGFSQKDAAAAYDAFIASVTEALKAGDKVQLVGFGTFERKDRPARVARNPRTGAEVKIAASKAPAFKAGKALKDKVYK